MSSFTLKRLDKSYFQFTHAGYKINDKIVDEKLYFKWKNEYQLLEEELDYALEELAKMSHNVAHFSSTGTFILSEYKP